VPRLRWGTPLIAVAATLFIRAVAALGERGVMDLIGVSGYYTLVSMVPNVAEIRLPDNRPPPWS
jgi:4-carboxymuconolactone decarboxylase